MTKKIIFLDVDGTLCDDAGNVPESARQAITAAHKKGHEFFLCTGRSKAEITEDVLTLPLSGMIGAGGGYCEVHDEVILHKVFEKEALLRLVDFLKENQIEYYLESNQGLFASTNLRNRLLEIVLAGEPVESEAGKQRVQTIQWFLDLLIEDEAKIDYDDLNKVSFINHSIPYERVHDQYHDQFQMIRSTVPVFGKDSGEIGIKNIHKKTAIDFLLNHLGIDNKDTLAFGDGHNDVEMFEAVATGIAMGNACEQLLEVANEVTARPEDGGIAQALQKHGLV